MPDCQRSDIENCTQEELVNTYDNTILYTDAVLAKTIRKLKAYEDKYQVGLIYASDHGESLGENGLYLHGTPYSLAPEEQTKIPFIVWFADDFAQNRGLNRACLQKQAKEGIFSHDNIFHSLLSVLNIDTQELNSELDLFGLCMQS